MYFKHGDSNTRFYNIWSKMISRCKNDIRYYNNGIIVCDRWLDYTNFKNDMFILYKKHCAEYGEKETTIDRIDVNGNYEPSNCRWATYKVQALNRRTNIIVDYMDNKYKIQEICDIFNLNRGMVNTRLKNGWSIEEIINIQSNKSNRLYRS